MNARGSFDEVELIRHHTVVASPYLCPEIRLHLIVEGCPLWTATEEQARAQGLAEPYWAFAWAGGQALARYLLDHPEVVRARTVLDFGAGGGVQSIAAAMSGGRVTANDVDPLAWCALDMNAALNQVRVEQLRKNIFGLVNLDYQVILAGDLCYEQPFSDQLLAWFHAIQKENNVEILLADPQRGFLNPRGLESIAVYPAPSDFDARGTSFVDTTVYRVR